MDYRYWNVYQDKQIVTLSLKGSTQLNTLTADAMSELRELANNLHDDATARVVILQGEGRHFSTGLDIQMLAERMDMSVDDNRQFIAELQRCVDDFESLGKPTIAKLQGFCIGGGLILALCCDFRVASKRTVFSLPEIKLGLPILWGTKRVTQVVGLPVAKEILYFGGRFKAEKALQYGLLHKVVEPDKLDQTVFNLAQRLLESPGKALELSKQTIHRSRDLTLREGQNLELEIVADLLASPETKHAFLQYAKSQGLME
jgi:enoyl-CoA hydratase/carnithine racemase